MTTTWKPRLNAFVLSDNVRAASLYATSSTLLAYYLTNTALICSYRPSHANPFITQVLPLATSDDLLMNVILATGGVHLCYDPDPNYQANIDTYKHYALALRALRAETVNGYPEWNYEKCLRVLLVLLLLGQLEALRGDVAGSIFPHIRAARPLMIQLLRRSGPHKSNNHLTIFEQYIVEMYVYLVIVSRIIPDDISTKRAVEEDSFLLSLEWLRRYPDNSTFLLGGYDLFELIPTVCNLARDRLLRYNAHQLARRASTTSTDFIPSSAAQHLPSLPPPDPTFDTRVSTLLTFLTTWTLPSTPTEWLPWKSAHHSALEVLRQSLIIYLKSTCIDHPTSPEEHSNSPPSTSTSSKFDPINDIHYPLLPPAAKSEIDTHVDLAASHMSTLIFTPFGATSLWSWIITGSCFRNQYYRDLSSGRTGGVQDSAFSRTGGVTKVRLMLDALWEESDKGDERAYGPFGLQRLMVRRGWNLSMA